MSKAGWFTSLSCFWIFLFALFVGLGIWQLDRLEQKRALLHKLESRIHLSPLGLGQLDRMLQQKQDVEYLPITFEGEFLETQDFLFYWTDQGRPGWRAVALVKAQDGSFLLVDRGFLLLEEADHHNRWSASEKPSGAVLISGRAVLPPARGWADPENNIAANQWYWWDIPAMIDALALDSDRVRPYIVLQEEGEGVLKSLVRIPTPSNRHLGYALTWFTLSACVIAFYGVSLMQHFSGQLRQPQE